MPTINKNKMRELLIKLMDLGLTNKEIAVKLNNEYEATPDNALSTSAVAKYKALVGLKGYKPKKKQLFELVDDDEVEITTLEFEDDDEVQADLAGSDFDEEEEFLNSPEARFNMGLGSEANGINI